MMATDRIGRSPCCSVMTHAYWQQFAPLSAA
jgi:hypothetical protein